MPEATTVRDHTITPTHGGVTAPAGFRSAALHCGIKVKADAGAVTLNDNVAGSAKIKTNSASITAERNTISGNVSPVVSFGEDEAGEPYYLIDGGLVYRFRRKEK